MSKDRISLYVTSHYRVPQKYRGFDGVVVRKAAGPKSDEEYHIEIDANPVSEVDSGNEFIGYDVGYFDSEYNFYSLIVNWGRIALEELNESLLCSEFDVALRQASLWEDDISVDKEILFGEEKIGPVAVWLRSDRST